MALVLAVLVATVWLATASTPDLAHAPPARTGALAPSLGVPAASRNARVTDALPAYGVWGVTRIGLDAARAEVAARHLGDAPASDGSIWEAFGRAWTDVPPPSDPAVTTASGPDGNFVMEDLAPGTWLILASFPDGRRAAQRVDLTRDAPRARVALAAPVGGYGLRGRAVHANGSPFVGWIGVRRVGAPSAADVWLVSERSGAFALSGLPPGRVAVSALRSGASLASAVVRLPRDEELILVVDALGAPRRGRVVAAADEAPVAAARIVTRTSDGASGVYAQTTSGTDGEFEFVSPGAASIEVSADGFVPARAEDDGKGDEILVQLDRSAIVAGRVVRVDGGPVPGAVVHVASAAANTYREMCTVSDADGRFRTTTCTLGRIAVYVRGGGWSSVGLADAYLGAAGGFVRELGPGATTDLVLAVEPLARANGCVVDADGVAVAAVRVEARRAVDVRGWPLGGRFIATVTGADGKFAFDDLVPGAAWTFLARPAIGEPAAAGPVQVAADATAQVEIRVDAPRLISVAVLDAVSGAPLGGAEVSVATTSHGPWDAFNGAPSVWVTSADGTILVGPVGASVVAVHARAHGHVEGHAVPRTTDRADPQVVVRLDPGLPLAGRVLLPAGVPDDRVRVVAEDRVGSRVHAEVGADGAFRIDAVADVSWTVYAMADWAGRHYRGQAATRAGAMTLTIPLEDPGPRPKFLVRVLGPDGAALTEGAIRYAFSTGAQGWTGNVRVRNGDASIPLPPSPARGVLVVRPETGIAAGTARVELVSPMADPTEVRLPPELRIRGRVLDPAGRPVAAVPVIAEIAGTGVASGSPGADGSAVTDRDGAFELGGLGNFVYRLHCTPGPELAQRAPVESPAGTDGVEIQLVTGVQAVLSVEGPDGERLPGCRVIVARERTVAAVATTSWDGIARIEGLESGFRYSLRIDPPSARDDLCPATREGWSPENATVRLAAARAIAGVVHDGFGRSLGGATVAYALPGAPWRTTTADAAGRFRIPGLGTEIVRLRAVADGEHDLAHRATNQGVVEATPGASELVLVADDRDVVAIRVASIPDAFVVPWRVMSSTATGWNEKTGTLRGAGLLRLRGLARGVRHRLLLGPMPDGRFALTDDLVPGMDETILHPSAGQTLTGRVLLPSGVAAADALVSVQGDLWIVRGPVDEHGEFRFVGLPPEEYRVTAAASKPGGPSWIGTVVAAPEARVTIELRVSGQGER